MRILSGIRPTGVLHLAHYLGLVKQWVALSQSDENTCFFAVVDYHALLSFRDYALDQASLDLVALTLAAGIDPKKATVFLQSGVSEHTELAWIFNAFVTVPELNRMTQYKDLIAQGTEQPSAALFTYPVLQAADVLLYQPQIVPVGEDQVQHIELARTIARRFNDKVGRQLFVEPKAQLNVAARVMSLHDPTKKMSKSLPQGALMFDDTEETLRKKIMRAVTDTAGQDPQTLPPSTNPSESVEPAERTLLFEHMSPGIKNLFIIMDEVAPADVTDTFLQNFRSGTLRYQELKETLATHVIEFMAPIQTEFENLRAKPEYLQNILEEGTKRAKAEAQTTLGQAKAALHLLTIS